MQKGTIFGIVAIFIAVGYIAYNEFPAQAAAAVGENRVYMHGIAFRNTIDNAQYTNGEPVSSEPQFSKVTIINWDDVRATDKALIASEATANGYTVAP